MNKYILSLVMLFTLSSVANAQTGSATLGGRVQDPGHAAVPGASVTVTNVATGVVRHDATNTEGRFLVPYLLPGIYAVTVENAGFERYEQTGIKLDVQETLSMDVTLVVGKVTTTVQVTGGPPAIATTTSTPQATMENNLVTDLPLISRNPLALDVLLPGVLPPQGSAGSGGSYGPFIGGGLDGSVDIRVDGISYMVNDANYGIMTMGGSLPNIDAIQEFTVVINNLPAEYGRTSGGAVLVASKQGTNRLHGDGYDFYRNNDMNAEDWFSNTAGSHLPALSSHQFGFSVGGPVFLPKVYNGHNRTFFFADYQGTRSATPSIFEGTVPTDAWKEGNFSSLAEANGTPITIYDPLTVSSTPNASGQYLRQPFPGNIIPSNRFDPVAAAMIAFYPEPNATPTNPNTQVDNYYKDQNSPGRADNFTLRMDETFSESLRSYWRFTKGLTISNPPNVWGTPATPLGRGYQTIPTHGFSWDNVYTRNPTTIFEFSFGVSRFANREDPPSEGFNETSLGFPAYMQAQASTDEYTRFPDVTVLGLTTLGQQNSAGIRFNPTGLDFNFSMTKSLSKHIIKTGVEYRKFFLNLWSEVEPSGTFGYTQSWTQQNYTTTNAAQGFGLASMLLGLGSGTQGDGLAIAVASGYWAGYIQDDYHLTPKLTLNVGWRYEVDVPRTERFNRLSYFDPTATSGIAGKVAGFPNLEGAMEFVSPNDRSQWGTNFAKSSPRFGFAYKLASNMAIRGGYSLMYAPTDDSSMSGGAGTQGFTCTTSMITSLDGRDPPFTYLSNPFPNGFCKNLGAAAGSISGVNSQIGQSITTSYFPRTAYMNPIIQEWNFNLQREMPGKVIVEAGYVGNKGNHLIDGGVANFNQLPPSDFSLGNALNTLVPNPFAGVILDPTSTLYGATVTEHQLLEAWPQYTAFDQEYKPEGNSNYHSFVLRVERRFSNGVGFLLGYTNGKTITDSGWGNTLTATNAATARQNVYDHNADRALSIDDVPQRLVLSFSAMAPVGRGRHFLTDTNRAVDAVIGGWQFNGIMTMQRGLPVVLTSSSNNTGLGSIAQRPNDNGQSAALPGQNKHQQSLEWFNTSVFSVAPAFTFGNAPTVMGNVRNPGISDFDLSMFKNFALRSENKLTLQARLEAADALNTTMFGRPGSVVGAAGFGQITSVGQGPRSVQIALKLLF